MVCVRDGVHDATVFSFLLLTDSKRGYDTDTPLRTLPLSDLHNQKRKSIRQRMRETFPTNLTISAHINIGQMIEIIG